MMSRLSCSWRTGFRLEFTDHTSGICHRFASETVLTAHSRARIGVTLISEENDTRGNAEQERLTA